MIRSGFPRTHCVVFLAAISGLVVAERPATAGGLFWPHGYSQTTRTRTQGSGVNVVTVPVQSLPIMQVAPVPVIQTVGVAPQMMFQAAPAQVMTQSGVSPIATGNFFVLQGAPAAATLTTPVQNPGTFTLSTSPTAPVTNDDARFLTAVFPNRGAFFQDLEKFVQGQLQDLVNGRGKGLTGNELETILLGLVKNALPPEFQAFSPEIVKLVDLILQRVVHRIVQNHQNSPAGPVTPANNPSNPSPPPPAPAPTNLPAGAISYEISGKLILTPSQGAPPTPLAPSNPARPAPPAPSNPAPPAPPAPSNPAPPAPPAPSNPAPPASGLTPDEPGLAPPAAPSR